MITGSKGRDFDLRSNRGLRLDLEDPQGPLSVGYEEVAAR